MRAENRRIQRAIAAGLESFAVQEPLRLSEWADRFFYLSAESSSIEGRWETMPYQVGPLNWIGDDDIQIFTWIKSARVGYTKCILAGIGYFAEHKRRKQLLYQPTDSDRDDFVVDEVDPMLRDVPVVGSCLKSPPDKKSQHNTREKKVFSGSILDLKGAKSGRNFRRMTKDVVYYDELDGFDRDVEGEGSPLVLGDKRVETSSFPKSVRGSTPRVKNQSLIEESWGEADMQMHRYVPCPECGSMQRLKFSNLKWDDHDHETAHFVCEVHGCVILYQSLPGMDAAGRWETVDGYYYEEETDSFFAPDGSVASRPRHIACHIWAAYSYFKRWQDIARDWIEAQAEAKKGNLGKLKTVVNTVLGESYEERGEKIDQDVFGDDRLENYAPDRIPNDVLAITIGADVQGGKNARIEAEILGHGFEAETWSIDYVVLPGDPEQQAVWDHLADQLDRVFTRDDGLQLRIAGGFVDSGYLPSRVGAFTGPRAKRNIFASKGGSTGGDGPLVGKPTWQGERRNRYLLYVLNTNEGKELLFNQLDKVAESGPGYCHFPAHYDAEYFRQLTAEEKREKRKSGVSQGYYWKKIRDRNEALDCRILNMAAFQKLNLNLPAIKQRQQMELERIRHGLADVPKKIGRRVRSRGI